MRVIRAKEIQQGEMVLIKIKGKKYPCPMNWDEVKDLAGLVSAIDLTGEMAVLTGAHLDGIPEDQIFPLLTLTSFLEEFDTPEIQCIAVEEQSYFKMQEAKAILTQPGRAYKKFYHLSKLYHPERTETVQIISTGVNLLNQIEVFLSHYEEMFSYEPTQEEKDAGIEEFAQLSAFGTLYNLAGKDLLKIDQVGESPAVIVYGVMMYNFKESEYQKKLWDIQHPPKPDGNL